MADEGIGLVERGMIGMMRALRADREILLSGAPTLMRWFMLDEDVPLDASPPESSHHWLICLDLRPVGWASLHGFEGLRCLASFGLADIEGDGASARKIVEAWMIRRAFEGFGIEKLCCQVLGYDEIAIMFHWRFGFRTEARLRRHVIHRGEPSDVIAMGLLRHEWNPDVAPEPPDAAA